VVRPQNHSDGFYRFGLKIGDDGFSLVWVLKPMATVCEWFDLKITRTVFAGLGSKPMMTVSSGLALKPATTVSPGLTSKSVVGFLVEPQNQYGGRFSGLGLKIGSSYLVIWASKSPQQFLGLCLKIKQVSVCRLCHKINGGRSA
jgi:hypothetical protein